jgi:hypothetical protein
MNTELLFNIFNTGVLLPWALLLFLPKWKGTQKMIEWHLPVVILGVAYLLILLTDFFISSSGSPIDFLSLSGIKAAFARDEVMLIGWIHYLAFDLFVGMWESVDARKNGISHFLLVPCLILTLFYGPVGFVLYWVLRQWYVSKAKKEIDVSK